MKTPASADGAGPSVTWTGSRAQLGGLAAVSLNLVTLLMLNMKLIILCIQIKVVAAPGC